MGKKPLAALDARRSPDARDGHVRPKQAAPTAPLGIAETVELPADARSAGRARAFVAHFCAAAGLSGETRRTSSLLVSELVTNALVHGRSGATVEICLHAGWVLRVAVTDDDPALLPEVDARLRTSAEDGRGLLIVSLLAARWGVRPVDGGGKTVWFELDA